MKRYSSLLVLMSLMLLPAFSTALQWQDLWWTADQQGTQLFKQDKPREAAEKFANPLWKGTAYYRAGDYQAAATEFAKADSALAWYNRGNALAHLGKYQEAIAAYDAALKKRPDFKDAAANKKLLEKLLQQPPQQNTSANPPQQQEDSSQKKSENTKNSARNNAGQAEPKQQPSAAPPQNSQNPEHNPQNPTQNLNNKAAPKPETAPQNSAQKNADLSHQSGTDEQPTPARTKPSDTQQQPAKTGQATSADQHAFNLQQQAQQQWLQQIPDDPGGLLKQKFLRDHLRQQSGNSATSE